MEICLSKCKRESLEFSFWPNHNSNKKTSRESMLWTHSHFFLIFIAMTFISDLNYKYIKSTSIASYLLHIGNLRWKISRNNFIYSFAYLEKGCKILNGKKYFCYLLLVRNYKFYFFSLVQLYLDTKKSKKNLLVFVVRFCHKKFNQFSDFEDINNIFDLRFELTFFMNFSNVFTRVSYVYNV